MAPSWSAKARSSGARGAGSPASGALETPDARDAPGAQEAARSVDMVAPFMKRSIFVGLVGLAGLVGTARP